jgi:hypothetical protein
MIFMCFTTGICQKRIWDKLIYAYKTNKYSSFEENIIIDVKKYEACEILGHN